MSNGSRTLQRHVSSRVDLTFLFAHAILRQIKIYEIQSLLHLVGSISFIEFNSQLFDKVPSPVSLLHNAFLLDGGYFRIYQSCTFSANHDKGIVSGRCILYRIYDAISNYHLVERIEYFTYTQKVVDSVEHHAVCCNQTRRNFTLIKSKKEMSSVNNEVTCSRRFRLECSSSISAQKILPTVMRDTQDFVNTFSGTVGNVTNEINRLANQIAARNR